jgi:asparagine N-glycosylation enzyme membrane subunit Stt3
VPVGLWYCVTKSSDGKVFVIAYVVTSVYFTGVMVRLMLVLTPAACVISGIAVAEVLSRWELVGVRLSRGADDSRLLFGVSQTYGILACIPRRSEVEGN